MGLEPTATPWRRACDIRGIATDVVRDVNALVTSPASALYSAGTLLYRAERRAARETAAKPLMRADRRPSSCAEDGFESAETGSGMAEDIGKDGGRLARAHKPKPRKASGSSLASAKAVAGLPLDAQAYKAIKERILTLYFLPGQYVNEGAVAALLGMGRTPVHQAMKRLQPEELVEVVPRKGVIIRPDSAVEILKILESRETVEPDLARHAAGKATVDDASQLRTLALAADQEDGLGAIEAFTRADRAFHARVAQLSDNAVLADFASLLHDRCMRFWYLHLWQTLDTKGTAREHLAISDAIAAGDGDAAAAAMRAHIVTLKERVSRIQHAAPTRQFAPHTSH